MTLARTEFKRKAPMQRTAKPATGKPRQKTCKSCKGKFDPRTPMQVCCGIPCAIEHAAKVTAAQKAKQQRQERAETKAKLEKFKKKGDYLHEAQTAFNAYIRFRDRDQPCICCGAVDAGGAGGVGGGWDAGHWLSRGHAPHLRFHEQNVHKQRKGCNRPGGTTRARYREGLVGRIGLPAVVELERLEYEPPGSGWSVDDLKEIRDHYRAKLAELKKTA